MGDVPTKLLQQALLLSESERAALAAALLDTLDEGADPDAESAWAAEIERRIAEVDSGAVQTIPWAKARAMIQRR
ncbi:MAG: addiction module protein [Betaproteobacteria bacterium]